MHIAVLGATGVVGQEILSVLEQRAFPVTSLRPLASARSAGRTVTFRSEHVTVALAHAGAFEGMDVAEMLASHSGIIANPNCVAIILTVAVAPIHRAVGVRRIVVSTYQSASGAGLAAIDELQTQARDILDGKQPTPRALPHPIAFNVFSHNTAIGPDGYNGEEMKVMMETRKILSEPDLAISATCCGYRWCARTPSRSTSH